MGEENRKEMDISPGMIAAGLEAYASFLESYRSDFETKVVTEVYAAMEAARRKEASGHLDPTGQAKDAPI